MYEKTSEENQKEEKPLKNGERGTPFSRSLLSFLHQQQEY